MLAKTEFPAARRDPHLLRRLRSNRSGAVGLAIVAFYVVIAICGTLGLTPYPSIQQHPRERLQGPSPQYVMGTDLFGRDVASRLMEGAGNSLRVAVLAVALSGTLGTLIGMTFAFPASLLALLVVAILGPGINTTVLAIAVVYTPIFARVARGPVLSVKAMDYILAARCLGLPGVRILFLHVLPNTLAPLIVQVSLALSWALLTEAGLSFLGLGTQPPQASWGVMLSESRGIAEMAPWLMFFPGLAIMLGVLGFNLLGDGLRDVLDPRLRGTQT
jgi:peptide/nickel transport system permease protein